MLAPRSYLFSSRDAQYEKQSKNRTKRPSPSPTKHAPMSVSSTSTTTADSRPTTPSSPVVIPTRSQHHESPCEAPRAQVRKGRHHGRKPRSTHSPDAISPSVAALLAITQIPQRPTLGGRTKSGGGQRLTVDAILEHTGVSEKNLSMSLGRSPLDYLLSPPEDLDDEFMGSENGQESVISARTVSSESMPSLEDDSISEASPSMTSLVTPSYRGRKSLPSRRMQALSSPPGESSSEDHPLSQTQIDFDELDFRVFQKPQDEETSSIELPSRARRSMFKSNLTASLRALRSAAKSFSSLTTPMLTPDDFLTRSIITIDPQVPFTDERMPPRLEDTPTPALRRYLNPTTNAPIEAHVPPSLAQTMPATKCTASIQMETYKVSRSAKGVSHNVISRRTQSTEDALAEVVGPVARQREMRENSDFIRIAVMEMAMRKKGKLDDQKPGRAKWALPPRKAPTKSYAIGEDGIPVRWISQVYE